MAERKITVLPAKREYARADKLEIKRLNAQPTAESVRFRNNRKQAMRPKLLIIQNWFTKTLFGIWLVFMRMMGKQRPIRRKEMTFYRVQEEMSRRANMWRLSTGKKNKECKGRHSGKYALTEILVCGECGRPYRRQIWSKYGEKKAVWRCENRLRDGTKYCRNSPTISEEALHETIMNAINNVLSDRETFINSFRENVLRVVITDSKEDTPTEYDKEIEKLKEQMI